MNPNICKGRSGITLESYPEILTWIELPLTQYMRQGFLWISLTGATT